MIYPGSFLTCFDNSGTKEIQCIRICQASPKKPGEIGKQLLVAVQSAVRKQRAKIQVGKLYKALLVQTKKAPVDAAGNSSQFANNLGVLLNSQGVPICSRFFGLLSYKIRKDGFLKLVSTAKSLY
jgi:large subunit ribosomal protein L14|tara:strand:- start:18042 stop:18416 length:375 start_codon:yes stop_codon:yes gene_type:complete